MKNYQLIQDGKLPISIRFIQWKEIKFIMLLKVKILVYLEKT